MNKRLAFFSAVSCVLLAVNSSAHAEGMKPGLWEYKGKVSSASGEMEAAMAEAREAMASLPPEQRRMMEQMMAARGMEMSMGADNTQVMRMCVSAKEAANFDIQSDPDCRQQTVDRSGNRIKIRFSCGGESRSRGEADITFSDGSSFSGTVTLHTEDDGEQETMTIQQEGRWLGADCGKLKPRS